MNLRLLKPGHKIRTRDGTEAEVLSEIEDGEWIRIKYLSGNDPLLGGTNDLSHKDEVEALLGVAVKGTWSEELTVIVHYRPEDEDSEGGYEATTITGVPHNVIVVTGNEDSAKGALNHLLDALRTFGFTGHVPPRSATRRPQHHAVTLFYRDSLQATQC